MENHLSPGEALVNVGDMKEAEKEYYVRCERFLGHVRILGSRDVRLFTGRLSCPGEPVGARREMKINFLLLVRMYIDIYASLCPDLDHQLFPADFILPQ